MVYKSKGFYILFDFVIIRLEFILTKESGPGCMYQNTLDWEDA